MQELYNNVGVVGFILILSGIFVICLLLLKIWQFNSLNVWRKNISNPERKNLSQEDCLLLIQDLSKNKNPVSKVVETLLKLKYIDRESDEYVESEVKRTGMNGINQLEEYLRPLEVMSHLSPLIGLLGTVLGIIVAFSAIKSASYVDPGLLSSGISHALITTALGLSVAIPAQVGFHFLDSKVEHVRKAMSNSVASFSYLTVE